LSTPTTTEIHTLSLHDALPISAPPPPAPSTIPTARHASKAGRNRLPTRNNHAEPERHPPGRRGAAGRQARDQRPDRHQPVGAVRSEEHTSELQSRENLVCRLLL